MESGERLTICCSRGRCGLILEVETVQRKRVLCFGDSNTWGYIAEGPQGSYVLRHPWGVRWPSVVAEVLGDDYEVLEDGCNGRTTGFEDPRTPGRNGLAYLEENLESMLPVDIAIVALGINDVKPDICGSVAGSSEAMSAVLDRLTASGISDVLLILPAGLSENVFSPPFDADFGVEGIVELAQDLRVAYSNLAASRYIPVLDAADIVTLSRDGLHMTADGHLALGKAVAAAIAGWHRQEAR